MSRTLLALLTLTACGHAEPAPSPAPHAAPVETTTNGGTEAAAAPGYTVHEWGLVDVDETGTAEIAAGPGAPPPMTSVRKPVLYFHVTGDPITVAVRARLLAGMIYETFPADTRPTPDVAAWTATLASGHCPTVVPAGRARDMMGCGTPDGICELPELPRYDAASADCVTVGSTSAGMLFYRGSSRPALPLGAVRQSDGTVHVTATGSLAGAPGEVLRVSTAMTGPWPMGHVVISRSRLPGPGETVVLPLGTVAVDRSAERTSLQASLLSLGLSADEADAFLNAWMDGLFGPGVGRETTAPALPQDSVLFFLPEDAVRSIAELELTPAPSELRRAFLVRLILPAVTTA